MTDLEDGSTVKSWESSACSYLPFLATFLGVTVNERTQLL
jgi:hypothetical protein